MPIHTFDAFAREQWEAEFWEWYREHRPDAIIGSQEYLTHLLPMMEAGGLKIPEELGLTSLHLDPINQHISGVLQNSLLVGKAAANTLVGLMQNYETGIPNPAHTILVEGQWYEGYTIRRE